MPPPRVAGMMKWYRVGTYAAALGLLLIAFGQPILRDAIGADWGVPHYRGAFEDGTPLQVRGGAVTMCEPGAPCVAYAAGRGLGGALAALSMTVLVLQIFLTIGLIQAIRDKQLERLPVWTILALVPYAICVGLVFLLVEAPSRGTLGASWGLLAAVAAIPVTYLAQTNIFDHLDDTPVGVDPVPAAVVVRAPAAPTPAAQVVAALARGSIVTSASAPLAVATTAVIAADFGHAGLRVRTEDGDERRVEWSALRHAFLDTSGGGYHLDLVTHAGEALRITPASRIDYRFLPGGIAVDDVENLRRLEQFARQRNPALS